MRTEAGLLQFYTGSGLMLIYLHNFFPTGHCIIHYDPFLEENFAQKAWSIGFDTHVSMLRFQSSCIVIKAQRTIRTVALTTEAVSSTDEPASALAHPPELLHTAKEFLYGLLPKSIMT